MDEPNYEGSFWTRREARVYNELHIGIVHEYFYHATQQRTKRLTDFFSWEFIQLLIAL